MKPLFVTGNKHKAENIQRLLGVDIDYQKLDVDEIQDIDPAIVVEHKVRQAYELVKRPVFVDDFSLWFDDMNQLPGTFIKYFITSENGFEHVCRMADHLPTRRATARAYFGYYDGAELKIIYGEQKGEIVDHPRGDAAFAIHTDFIFALNDYDGRTRAELTQAEYDKAYEDIRAIDKIRKFLKARQ